MRALVEQKLAEAAIRERKAQEVEDPNGVARELNREERSRLAGCDLWNGGTHERVPNGGGSGDARGKERIHRRIVIVSYPNGDDVAWCVPNCPVIPLVIACPCFDCDGFSGNH